MSPGTTVEDAPPVETVTSTLPASWAGETAEQLVADAHDTPVAETPPKLTVVAPAVVEKLVPVMVTVVPPFVGPPVGVMDETVGAAAVV